METTGMPDNFDRTLGQLQDLPDVTFTQSATVHTTTPIVGHQVTTMIRTCRQAGAGDTVFVEVISREGAFRYVLAPKVSEAIARQRESLHTMVRRKHGRRIAAERKKAGLVPGFMANPGKGKARRRKAGAKK